MATQSRGHGTPKQIAHLMKLHVGDRLPGSGPPGQPGGYLVTGVLRETPWSNLYAARKILYNFDFANQRCRESDEGEWLDVLLRTCSYEDLQTPQEAARRRAVARDEVRRVLARRASNVWPEPLDLLEGESEAEDSAGEEEAQDRDPIIALAQPHGDSLRAWLARRPSLADRLNLIAELLSLVESTHRDGLMLNGLGPEAFVVDAEGRLGYLASDCVVPLDGAAAGPWPYGALFPPDRYPAGFSPPECFDPAGPRDQRTDLFAWSALTFLVITGEDPERVAQAQGDAWLHFQPAHATRLQEALGHVSLGGIVESGDGAARRGRSFCGGLAAQPRSRRAARIDAGATAAAGLGCGDPALAGQAASSCRARRADAGRARQQRRAGLLRVAALGAAAGSNRPGHRRSAPRPRRGADDRVVEP